MLSELPPESVWTMGGVGDFQFRMNMTALIFGGGVRIGLEDNLYYARGVKATNEMLVARAARVVREFGNEPATPAEAREMLGLKPLLR